MYISDLPMVLVRCLILTIIMELAGALIIGVRDRKDLLNITLVNIITNPIVVVTSVAINFWYGLKAKNIAIIFLELFALLSEALIYRKVLNYKKINWFLVSLILNSISYWLGEVLNKFVF